MPEPSDSRQNDVDHEEREAEVNRTLFIRSLPDRTTEDELYELFLQAGPLEKVAIPQNKNMAFITYKHSVSAPYAKEIFCDTKLHGRILNVDFRTGSTFADNARQSRQGNYNGNQQSRHQGNAGHQGRPYPSQSYSANSNYGHASQQNGLMPYPSPSGHSSGYVVGSPFAANPQSMPQVGIQGYRSSAGNREYVPQYVSIESPPTPFRGAPPVNHPDHQVSLDERRNRLLSQQRYVVQADMYRNQPRRNDYRR